MTTCCTSADSPLPSGDTMLLVGHPNVGKSVLFHRLTGTYVTVSNYPGTTVEVARAALRSDRGKQLLDTPGVLSLPARSDDERATMRAILNEDARVLIQVGDAKNLRRTLALTALLAELGVPLILVLNMGDEAKARGVAVDSGQLAEALGVPVVQTVATNGEGVVPLTHQLTHTRPPIPLLHYDDALESEIGDLAQGIEAITPHPRLAARGLAILFLGGDPEVAAWLAVHAGTRFAELEEVRRRAEKRHATPLSGMLARERAQTADALARTVVSQTPHAAPLLSQRIGQLVVHRLWGLPVLLAILFALYEFVGVFGAGTLVGLVEKDLFEGTINPAIVEFVGQLMPASWLADLLVGPYGLWTMGMTYALALVLPIVTTFFIAFGVLEDSGYFARLSVLANRLFSVIGLNGRAVLPMVLGLGCVTMATLTTRILHSRRERLIMTFLLALAIPCSAQLGVVLGMLGAISFGATLTWAAAVTGILILAGFLAARLVPGRRIPLVTELPPLRMPILGNVLKKTAGRLKWYLAEVIPLFLAGTFIMFVLDRAGILPRITTLGEPLVSGWLGLPKEASAAFVMGFLRRDFGATGLFALGDQLSPLQTVVGMVTITLFVPCIASVMMIIKEQGARVAGLILALIMPFAFFAGGVVNALLQRIWS